jgi:hypothetical protein
VSGVVTRMYKTQTPYLNFAKTYGAINPQEMTASDAEIFSKVSNVMLLFSNSTEIYLGQQYGAPETSCCPHPLLGRTQID